MTQLKDWERPYFEASIADASIYYVAYGKPPKSWNISGSEYRVSGIPEGINIHTYGPDVNPETLDRFRNGYLWDQILKEKPSFASQIFEETECLIIQGSLHNPETLNYFRDLTGLIQWLFDSGIKGVFDPHAFLWWTPEAWDEIFHKAEAAPHSHVMIFTSPENGKIWLHTRGMRKFGRPDISIRGCPFDRVNDAGKLINKFIEIQSFGAVILEGKEINLEGLPSGMTCAHKGHLDDPDFNNVHFEILWPN
jgi:hypothetical protein